jgi:hypothetical protein
MNSISGYDKWLTTPPDEPPYCESGCGDTLERDMEGDWVCENKFCPTKFQGVEKEMAEALVEFMDAAHTNAERLRYRKLELDDLMKRLAEADSLLYEFQNNPNIELGEKGHEKIENYFASTKNK